MDGAIGGVGMYSSNAADGEIGDSVVGMGE